MKNILEFVDDLLNIEERRTTTAYKERGMGTNYVQSFPNDKSEPEVKKLAHKGFVTQDPEFADVYALTSKGSAKRASSFGRAAIKEKPSESGPGGVKHRARLRANDAMYGSHNRVKKSSDMATLTRGAVNASVDDFVGEVLNEAEPANLKDDSAKFWVKRASQTARQSKNPKSKWATWDAKNAKMSAEDALRKSPNRPRKNTDMSTLTKGVHTESSEGTTMNANEYADKLIKEALVNHGPNNITSNNTPGAPGGTERQMLGGELFGSVAWPLQMPNDEEGHQGMIGTINQQSGDGLGMTTMGKPYLLRGVNEAVNSLLSETEDEDDEPEETTEAEEEDDKKDDVDEEATDTVECLIESLNETGHDNFAQTINRMCEEGYTVEEYNAFVDILQRQELRESEGHTRRIPDELREGIVAFMAYAHELLEQAGGDHDNAGGPNNDDESMDLLRGNPVTPATV